MAGSFGAIVLQILVPFVAGHLVRPWIGAWVHRSPRLTRGVDQGSILLVVYAAFSQAVVEGLWKQIPLAALAGLVLVDFLLLGIVMVAMWTLGSLFRFDRADKITILFCGSKKSLARGEHCRPDDLAFDAVPSNSAHGLRSSGATLGTACLFGPRGSGLGVKIPIGLDRLLRPEFRGLDEDPALRSERPRR